MPVRRQTTPPGMRAPGMQFSWSMFPFDAPGGSAVLGLGRTARDGTRTRSMARTRRGSKAGQATRDEPCPHDGGDADGETAQRHPRLSTASWSRSTSQCGVTRSGTWASPGAAQILRTSNRRLASLVQGRSPGMDDVGEGFRGHRRSRRPGIPLLLDARVRVLSGPVLSGYTARPRRIR